jgi:hypothetical protein
MPGVSPNRVTQRRGVVNGLRIWQDWRVRAIGAVGSALRSHRRGHRFESGIAHNISWPRNSAWQPEPAAIGCSDRTCSAELGEHARREQHGIRRPVRDPRQSRCGKQGVVEFDELRPDERPRTVPIRLYRGLSTPPDEQSPARGQKVGERVIHHSDSGCPAHDPRTRAAAADPLARVAVLLPLASEVSGCPEIRTARAATTAASRDASREAKTTPRRPNSSTP